MVAYEPLGHTDRIAFQSGKFLLTHETIFEETIAMELGVINPSLLNWIIYPILIFFARIADVSIGTIRIIFVSRGMKYLAPALGFFEVLIWLLAIGHIMQNLNNPINYLAYASGFGMGNYVGILLEKKLAMGTVLIRIITRRDASELVQHLRQMGYVVTSVDAEGNEVPVKVIFTVVKRKDIPDIAPIIKRFNPNAYYTIEDVTFISDAVIPSLQRERKFSNFNILKRK